MVLLRNLFCGIVCSGILVIASPANISANDFADAGFEKVDSEKDHAEPANAGEDDAASVADYKRFRSTLGTDVESQLKMAKFCSGRGLPDRCRAHLLAAARETDQPAIRVALREAAGDMRLGMEWLEPREFSSVVDQLERRQDIWKQSAGELSQWRVVLDKIPSSNREAQRARNVREQLARFNHPEADWIVGRIFGEGQPMAARAGIEYLAARNTIASTAALSLIAVASQWEGVRGDALAALKSRSPNHYVPTWMSLLHKPISARTLVIRSDTGETLDTIWRLDSEDANVRLRQYASTGMGGVRDAMSNFGSYHSRGQWRVNAGLERFRGGNGNIATARYLNAQMNRIHASDRTRLTMTLPTVSWGLRRIEGATGFANRTYVAAPSELGVGSRQIGELRSRKTQQKIDLLNDNVATTNRNIVQALRKTAWDDIPEETTPAKAWAWWHAYNGLAKPTSASQKELIEVREDDIEQFRTTRFRASASCFAAGTQVWTPSGAVAIETIQTGDRVLSANIDTGQLEYAIVLYPTMRTTEAKYDLTLSGGTTENETIRASAGHPFWDMEHGWTTTKHLHVGAALKTIDDSVSLASSKQIAAEDPLLIAPVYNLVVDQNHNYFVGETRLLAHDNTIPQPRNLADLKVFAIAN